MNLKHLFELQAKLDERIYKEHPPKEGEDRLAKKTLALQVELAECAQESRCFKFWSHNQEPRIRVYDKQKSRIDKTVWKNPLLEEYVDVVHFTLSVGLEIEIKHEIFPEPINYGDAVIQFNELFGQISYFASVLNRENDREEVEGEYERIWSLLFGLAGLLGFTWDQVEQGYMKKNAENHRRQDSGMY